MDKTRSQKLTIGRSQDTLSRWAYRQGDCTLLYETLADLQANTLFAPHPEDGYVGCGIKTAQNVLKFFGVEMTQAQLQARISTHHVNVPLLHLKIEDAIWVYPDELESKLRALLDEHGCGSSIGVVRLAGKHRDPDFIKTTLKRGLPVIALVNEGSHYVTVTGHDSARGYRVLSNGNAEWWPDVDLRFGKLAHFVRFMQNLMQDNDFDEGTVITFVDKGAVLREMPTALGEVDRASFQFLMAPNLDLVAIKKRDTGSRMTEVHVLSAASNYQDFVLQAPTKLGETDASVEFALGPDNDLWAFKKSGTGTRSTEIHVLSAASSYQAYTLQTGTGLHETDASFQFLLSATRDVFAIKKQRAASHSTEVHVLSATSNYQAFSLHTGTALHETDANFTFALNPHWRDVVAVKKATTATKTTEVHILRGLTTYKTFSLHTPTLLPETGPACQFFLPADFNSLHQLQSVNNRLWGVRTSGTAFRRTEVLMVSY